MPRKFLVVSALLIPLTSLVALSDSKPVPVSTALRTTVIVDHPKVVDGYTCSANDLGHVCRDISHWRVVADNDERWWKDRDDALKAVSARIQANGPEVPALVCAKKSAPIGVVQRIVEVFSRSGIARVLLWTDSTPPTAVHEIRVVLDFDSNAQLVSRRIGETAVAPKADLSTLLKDQIRALAQEPGSAIVVVVDVSGAVPLDVVLAAEKSSMIEGIAAVERVLH